MPTNQTANYALSQWVKSDQVKMEDFNADNAKIDAAIKAEADARTALAGQVAQKAEQSALNALSATVSGHTTTLGKKGNCQIYTTTYNGNGTCGADHPNTLSFPKRPLFVAISGYNNYMLLVNGSGTGIVLSYGGNVGCPVSFSGYSVSWYNIDVDSQMNKGGSYRVVALLES